MNANFPKFVGQPHRLPCRRLEKTIAPVAAVYDRRCADTPAYCQDLEAAPLQRTLAEADRSRIAEYRAEQEPRIRRLMATKSLK